ncbi:hypothetical protein WN51_04735 [Melipona quadrifasciata]|uniref:Uncharacterized protein n=1 Tax=Melipona quadrifasciata TaxID=166423 RepID=A0A0N0U3R2_9HYME|nr:hypothetical protein WN51_04735 [Melipona quadrifasciata]
MRTGHRISSRLRTNRNKSNDAEPISSTVLVGCECFASRRRRDRGHTSSLVAATTDAYGGVPEPALSEPAQQLIGVRSGGERGHYCTTTPRLEKIRYINQLLVNGQTFPRGKGREVEEGEEGQE